MKRIILFFTLSQLIAIGLLAQSIEEKCVNCKKNELSNYSSSLGIENDATGQTSFASGTMNESTGDYSTTLGYKNIASGLYSLAGGEESMASQKWAFAFGQRAKAEGFRSFAQGMDVTAMGPNSVVIGRFARTLTGSAMVIGYGLDQANTLDNNIPNSLMIGFNSESATLFVGPSDQTGYGKVGIGTTTPTSRLEVNGTFKVNDFSYMSTINLDDSDIWYIDELAGHGGLKFRGETDLTSTQMILTEDGMLGIGTTSPTEMLEVTGNILQTSGYNIVTSQIKAPDAYGLNLTDQSGNGIFVDYGGNVGIGTSNPTKKLDVNGNIKVHDNILLNGNWLSGDGDPQGVFVDNLGNVGIGTNSPGNYRLAVAGTILAEEVMVQHQDKWYDYVFEDDYDLISLSDLSNFISENKHLPDVPSEKEVLDNGISLGEMNGTLLKKIEELTLYLLEQQKEIEGLRSEMTKHYND